MGYLVRNPRCRRCLTLTKDHSWKQCAYEYFRNLILSALVAMATACGGGGGGNSTPAQSPGPVAPPTPTDPAPTPTGMDALHSASRLASRAAFGMDYAAIEQLAAQGEAAWL